MLKHRVRDRLYKRAVGLLVVCSLLLVLLLVRSLENTERFLGRTFQLHAQLAHVGGLEVDSKVTLAGLKVGKVQAIELMPDKSARLTLHVELRYQDLVRSDSVATLTRPLIGNAVVDIGIGTATLPRLEDGATITLLVKPDLNDVVASMPAKLERVDHALENLAAITEMARGGVQRLTDPKGPLHTTLAEAQATVHQVHMATGTLQAALTDVRNVTRSGQDTMAQVQGVLSDVQSLSRQSAAMAPTLQRTLGNAEALTQDLRTLVPQLGSGLHAAQSAAEEADKVLRAASNSFLLGGPTPVAPAPTLISPRAP